MSVRVMAWAFDSAPTTTGIDQLVLLAIADHTDDAGVGAYPSIARLAAKTRLSKRSVQRAIRNLENAGVLKVGIGPRGTHAFTILGVTISHPQPIVTPTNGPQGGDSQTPGGVTNGRKGVTNSHPIHQ